ICTLLVVPLPFPSAFSSLSFPFSLHARPFNRTTCHYFFIFLIHRQYYLLATVSAPLTLLTYRPVLVTLLLTT
ncbi:hypothetical protein BC826DRAFT_954687, partial [Russula brevipes]